MTSSEAVSFSIKTVRDYETEPATNTCGFKKQISALWIKKYGDLNLDPHTSIRTGAEGGDKLRFFFNVLLTVHLSTFILVINCITQPLVSSHL